ncbi:iron transporter [Nocardia sp. MH4]|uniref:IucA/IucC family protein n=1 Tax=Nocardia TaxID=1817 RepID=UPI001C4EE9CE|nr:IucA/IucC family protein [Nocardia sp. MH4]MBW0272570.1 iron transporter [Nocardia sp. MH4]
MSNTALPETLTAPSVLPSADDAVAHTLLNCLLREVSGPESQSAVSGDHLLLRLPRRDVLLRIRIRRTSRIGAHRFLGPVEHRHSGQWRPVDWQTLARYAHDELALHNGVANDEFLAQIASSHATLTTTLESVPDVGDLDYLSSERSLIFGHRFHPTPKARTGSPEQWARYSPEVGAGFGLRMLAVRTHLIAEESNDQAASAALDDLGPTVPVGYRLLPAHPWQYEMMRTRPAVQAALDRGDIIDLGVGTKQFAATASVRTVYDGTTFLKFSLNVRITNCLRKNAWYELTGAVTLDRILAPIFEQLHTRFPGSAMLREPAYRSLALPGTNGGPDRELLEGFGVIVREGLSGRLRPGVTALLAAAVADEYPTGPAHISRLLPDQDADQALRWWDAYLDLLVAPILAAYFEFGVVLEPHLQNVLIGVDGAGLPVQVLFRDLEGTKLVADQHEAVLAALLPEVGQRMTYDAHRGWDRVVYCLFVNNIADMLAALADLHPALETVLWERVRDKVCGYSAQAGHPPRLAALLAGVPLPAKANLLTRWERKPDRDAGYVRLPSPLTSPPLSEYGTSALAELTR